MSGHWGDYPPGSDHKPRGDTPEANQRYRDGWDRMFSRRKKHHPNCTISECGQRACDMQGAGCFFFQKGDPQ